VLAVRDDRPRPPMSQPTSIWKLGFVFLAIWTALLVVLVVTEPVWS
jgi:hypothetical protein